MNTEYIHEIAETIISQIGGGRRLKAMVGTTNIVCGETEYEGFKQPMVYFNFKMNRKMNYCKIIYQEGKDLYAMQFLKCGKNGCKIVREYSEVFCDQLVELFEETTGLTLRLF